MSQYGVEFIIIKYLQSSLRKNTINDKTSIRNRFILNQQKLVVYIFFIQLQNHILAGVNLLFNIETISPLHFAKIRRVLAGVNLLFNVETIIPLFSGTPVLTIFDITIFPI